MDSLLFYDSRHGRQARTERPRSGAAQPAHSIRAGAQACSLENSSCPPPKDPIGQLLFSVSPNRRLALRVFCALLTGERGAREFTADSGAQYLGALTLLALTRG